MPAVTPVYRTGAAKADIMDTRPGLVMDGYAYPQQATTGAVDVALFARAFVIEETRTSAARRLCLVVIDAWSAAEPLKTLVLQKLPAAIRNKFNRANLVISATHTHCGPGGYAHYFLYNLTTGGHDIAVRDKMVSGIVQAITDAYANLLPGRVYVAQGDLAGCGDNRSVAAYRANPEGQAADAYAKRTDTEMTVLRLTQDAGATEKEIGLYSLYAVHPTNLGMFNVEISGDNKGWAAKRCEDVKAAGYVAGFANANAGDVSPNALVAGNWQTSFTVPMGGPDDLASLAANKAAMKVIGQKQADMALALVAGEMTELVGRIDYRATHVDMSSVRVAGKRTAKPAVGVSFAAGSHEDSIGLATFSVLGFNFDVKPEISEGMNAANYATGKAATKALAGSFVTTLIANASGLANVLAAAGLVTASGKLDDIRASAPARSWTFGNFARALFPGEAGSHDPQKTGPAANPTTWQWIIRNQDNWPTAYVAGQGVKPIVFPVGITELRKRRGASDAIVDAPLVPHVLPLQVAAIGSLVLAILPSEFTTVAGRRLKAKMKSVMGTAASHVGLVGYANDYGFYVTTSEEYELQHYEGASTLYGPNTLAAYLQEMGKLATAMKAGTTVPAKAPVPPPAIFYKT